MNTENGIFSGFDFRYNIYTVEWLGATEFIKDMN